MTLHIHNHHIWPQVFLYFHLALIFSLLLSPQKKVWLLSSIQAEALFNGNAVEQLLGRPGLRSFSRSDDKPASRLYISIHHRTSALTAYTLWMNFNSPLCVYVLCASFFPPRCSDTNDDDDVLPLPTKHMYLGTIRRSVDFKQSKQTT